MDANTKQTLLVYDAACPLCSAAAQWVNARTQPDALRLVPCHSGERAALCPQVSEQACSEAIHVVTPAGEVYAGADALPALLATMRGWHWAAGLMRLPGVARCARPLYRWIAAHRYACSALFRESVPRRNYAPRNESQDDKERGRRMEAACPDTRYLPNSKECFVCGEENPAGLRLRFYVEDDAIKVNLNAQKHHCGYESVVHGGIIAAAIDECMAWAATRAIGLMCVTGDLNVRYIHRVPCQKDLTVCARVTKSTRRIAYVEAELSGHQGTVYARAEGRFLPMSAEETLQVDDGLLYRGGEERLFDALREENQ